MVFDQHCRNAFDIQILKALHCYKAGVVLVGVLDFLRRHGTCAGDFSVKIIALCSTVSGDTAARLYPAGGPAGMGMHHAADIRERFVKDQMGGQVGGRTQRPLHNVPIHIYRLLVPTHRPPLRAYPTSVSGPGGSPRRGGRGRRRLRPAQSLKKCGPPGSRKTPSPRPHGRSRR